MGFYYYCGAGGNVIFAVPKPNIQLGIGMNALPPDICNSRVLTGNYLGMLANVQEILAYR